MSCKCDTINIVNDNNIIVVSHADGRDGKSAYQQAVEGGYTGTEQEFNCSLSLLADVAEGKKQIADAINTKGGSASADSSFSQLAEDIQTLPYAGISAEGIVQTEEFSFLEYCCNLNFNKIIEINNNSIEEIFRAYAFYGFNANFALNNVFRISGSYCFAYSTGSFELNNLYEITAEYVFYGINTEELNFPRLTILNNREIFANIPSLKRLYTNIESFYLTTSLLGTNNLEELQVGKLVRGIIFYQKDSYEKLRNIIIGEGTDVDINFQCWSATDVINAGYLDELNSNLYNNLLTKLYDHSTDGQTRTLRLGWLAHVTQENIDYANSKGWTLTT